jgi:hypothetical protein
MLMRCSPAAEKHREVHAMPRYIIGGEMLLAFDAAFVLEADNEAAAREKAEAMTADHHVDWGTMTVAGFSARRVEQTTLPVFPDGANCEDVPPHILSGDS